MLKIKKFFAFLLIASLFGFAQTSIAKEEEEIIRLPELNIELKVEKSQVIRGESIPFTVTLTNNGNSPAEIYEIAPVNEVLTFTLKKKGKKDKVAGFKDPYLKTGGKIPEGATVETFVLNPKQTKNIKGDFLRIFGDISPGAYSVLAHYKSRGGVDLKTAILPLRIYNSNPVYAYSQWEYDKITDSNIKTVWVNKGKYYRLFYTENNPQNPNVVESSYPIQRLSGWKEVKISSVNGYMQKRLHLLWKEGSGLTVLEIEDSKVKGKAKRIKLPYRNFELLNPPFTDDDGNLYVFIAVNNTKTKSFSVILVKLFEDEGDVEKREIATISGTMNKLTKYALFIDGKSQATFAVHSGRTIAYLVYDLIGKKLLKDVKSIENIKDRVVDVMITKQFKPEKGTDSTYVYYLTKVKGKRSDYTGYLLELGEKEAKWYPTMNVYYPERLKIAQGVMDSYLRPYYLLSSYGMKRFFKPYFSIDLDEVLPPKKEPKALCTYPQLIVSSTLGEKYGVYLRYIKNRNRFAWDFLHEIKSDE